MKRTLATAAIIGLLLLVACGGETATTTTTSTTTTVVGTEVKIENGSYWVITPAELYSFKTKDFLLVNLDNSPFMIIQDTDLYVKPAEIQQNLDKFPSDKNQKIVLYCMTGTSFAPVATALVNAGYTRVMALEGGVLNWQQQGYPVLNYTQKAN
jgi:rhodanese-related sulfurtransferase